MARIAQEVRRAYAACAAALVSGGVDLDAIDALGLNVEMPVFTVSQAAQIAGVHPQTLRQYDRLGLVVPQRTEGGARRYTLRDVARLAQAQQLSQDEGINLAGVTHILSLQEENRQLRRQIRHLRRRLDGDSVFEAGMDGEVVEVRQSPFYHGWEVGGGDTESQTIVCHFVHNVGYNTVPDSDFAMPMKIE